ncbi:glycosyl hydrolase [Haloferula sp. A504]|uniref:glycosyl hydrolase n=1 Tax=Haloferula sp. A504 TaxID=3373601 RepID=UPI0031BFC6AE|nr:hypothetical protein [Verrucomicrobiaceae bacterium E54]
MKLHGSLSALLAFLIPLTAAGDLDSRFTDPVEETKPWCYWYWLGGDITAEGLTRDLESMAEVGIKKAFTASISGRPREGRPHVEILTDDWMELFRHALREAHRLDIEIGMFNSPGYSMSGGPWNKPEQSMRHVIWTETPAEGGGFSEVVRPVSKFPVQDIAVMAVPRRPFASISSRPDGNVIRFQSEEPITARSMSLEVGPKYTFAGTLHAKLADGSSRQLLRLDRPDNSRDTCDSQPTAPEIYSFAEVTAKEFILELEGATRKLLSATISAEPKVSQPYEKQLARLHARQFPEWKQHVYPDTVEPAGRGLVLQANEVHLIDERPDAEGRLTCTLPEGSWTVLCFGMTSTGKTNIPAPPEATGLECDKLSKEHTRHHLESMFTPIFAKLSAEERSVIKTIVADSYEAGTQNWTDDFDQILEQRIGYDPIRFLPTFTGRTVNSAEASDTFLSDLRRTVADLISENYLATINEYGDEVGLDVWMENYGSWGFPGDALYYGKHADMVSGEFWMGRPMGVQMCRIASSTAHIYGKPRVFAESYTSFIKPFHHPYVMKRRAEELFTHGVNHAVLHVVVHQPQEGVPGRNPWFGIQFHRNTPWFMSSRSWVKYHQRMHTMLQEGKPSADIAVYYGDFSPITVGPENPVPHGYDFDYINSDVLLNHLEFEDSRWVIDLPGASSYGALVIPDTGHVRPAVARRIAELKKAGGPVFDSLPITGDDLASTGLNPVVWDANQDFKWKVRETGSGRIFLLCNFERTGPFEANLKVEGLQPEFFDPVTGQIRKLATWREVKGGTRVRFQIDDLADSCFVVFREPAVEPSVTAVDGPIHLWLDDAGGLVAEGDQSGIHAVTSSDGSTKQVQIEAHQSAIELQPHGEPDAKGLQTYTSRFVLPSGIRPANPIRLDLGDVQIMAGGSLNGRELETRWMPPFAWEVGEFLRPGENRVEIVVSPLNQDTPARIGGPTVLKWEVVTWR